VSLTLPQGSLFALLGSSGSGKTTLLRLVAGALTAQRGRILLADRDVTDLPPERRNLGMVYQSYALFPHRTARQNVAFGLEARGLPRPERQLRVEEMLDRVGLAPAERDRRPAALSGGQQQRVALARALVIEPALLLLDEPLANIDRLLRDQLRGELRALQRRTGVTTLLVTHDQEEALALADQVGVLAAGRLLQVGAPADVYLRPRTPAVARFLGLANLWTVEAVEEDGLLLTDGLTLGGVHGMVRGTVLMARPEHFLLGPAAASCSNRWTAPVLACSFHGPDALLEVALPAAHQPVRVRCRAADAPAVGALIAVGLPAEALWAIPDVDPPGLDDALGEESTL
jgi:ABC-type Fe3+/spermidine/putrescine transport system ATPase subunit